MDIENARWMSVKDVAREMEISQWVVRQLIDDGELKVKRVGRKPMIRIHRDDFERYRDRRDN